MPGNGVTAKQRLQMNTKGNTNFVALMGAMQVVSMANAFWFKAAVLSPEPKTQHEARSRPDVQDWIHAEWIEMDTVYGMGTIEYVLIADLPANTSLIPTKFAYKCKFGDKGIVIKKKARLVVRGDLQKESEYSETFAPTS
eukprot:971632-Rhodomonas_salina.1